MMLDAIVSLQSYNTVLSNVLVHCEVGAPFSGQGGQQSWKSFIECTNRLNSSSIDVKDSADDIKNDLAFFFCDLDNNKASIQNQEEEFKAWQEKNVLTKFAQGFLAGVIQCIPLYQLC
jgi:hypothetical protein